MSDTCTYYPEKRSKKIRVYYSVVKTGLSIARKRGWLQRFFAVLWHDLRQLSPERHNFIKAKLIERALWS